MIVLDASVALKTVIKEKETDEAISVLETTGKIIAPSLLFAEFTNVMGKKIRGNQIGKAQFEEAQLHLLGLVDEVIHDYDLIENVGSLVQQLNHSAYDCFYLAAALRTGAPLLTYDEIFQEKAAKSGFGQFVIRPRDWLGRPAIGQDNIIALVSEIEKIRQSISELLSIPLSGAFKVIPSTVGNTVLDSIPYNRLKHLLQSKNVNERARLLTIAWIGRGNGISNWPSLYNNALSLCGDDFDLHAPYVIGLMKYLQEGLAKIPESIDFRSYHFPEN